MNKSLRSSLLRLLTAGAIVLAFTVSHAIAATYNATYLANSAFWEQDGNWDTTAYPQNGRSITINDVVYPGPNPFYNVAINNSAPCNLGISVNIQTLVLGPGATLSMATNIRLNAALGINNSGQIILNSDGSSGCHLRTAGGFVEPTGIIYMSDSGANYISGTEDLQTFTIETGGAVRGAGQINHGYFGNAEHLLNIVNHGVIEAIHPGNALQIGLGGQAGVNANLTNDATLRASGNGILRIQSFGQPGTVFNNGGTIVATDNGQVRIADPIVLTGGTVTTSGNGSIRGDGPGGVSGVMRDLTSNGRILVENSETVRLGGQLVNNGTIVMNSTGGVGANLFFTNNTILSGTGTFTMSNSGANFIYGVNSGDAVTIGPAMTLQGAGNISPGFSGTGILNITNNGLIHANQPAAMVIRMYESVNARVTNNGTLRATGSTMALNAFGFGIVTNNGVFEALNGGTISLGTGATLSNLASGTLTGGTYRVVDTGSGATLQLNAGGITTNAATVILSGANAQFPGLNSLTQNNGTLVLDNGASLSLSGSLSSSRTKARQTNGTFPNAGALVLGNGSSLNVNGDFSQGSGGSLEVTIGGAYPQNFHALNVSGTATLAGTLIVKLANGYTPAPNETLPIIQAGAISGGFVNVIGATVSYGLNGVSVHPTGNTNAFSLSSAVSRKTHGSAGDFDINLPGIECRATGGNHKLVFTFSNALANASATYTNGTNTLGAATTISGNKMTVDLTGVSDQQNVTVNLKGVTDVYSQVLDTAITIGFLIGDANADRSVNSADATITRNRSGNMTDATNFRADYNIDGTINAADATTVRNVSGHFIP